MLTDEHMQTNVPGIYAAGDCAEAFDLITGRTMVSAIQPNAADQARVAGLNMAGQHAELKGVTQINVLDTLGLVSTSFGDWQGVPGGDQVELTDRARRPAPEPAVQGRRDGGLQQHRLDRPRGRAARPGRRPGEAGAWKDHLKQDPTRLMEAYIASAQGQSEWLGAADERRR